jgi:hypothetical protein
MSRADIAAAEADIRWRAWQAQGAAADRRRAAVMGRVVVVIAIGLAIWLLALVV